MANIVIGGELQSVATGNRVASANAIYDYKRNKMQEKVNDDLEQKIDEGVNNLKEQVETIGAGCIVADITTSPSTIENGVSTPVTINVSAQGATKIRLYNAAGALLAIGYGGALNCTKSIVGGAGSSLTAKVYVGENFKEVVKTIGVSKRIYFGAGSSELNASQYKVQEKADGSYVVNIVSDGSRVFFLVPNDMSISNALVNGLAFPLEDPVPSTSKSGYKCYRSSNTYDIGLLNIEVGDDLSLFAGQIAMHEERLAELENEQAIEKVYVGNARYPSYRMGEHTKVGKFSMALGFNARAEGDTSIVFGTNVLVDNCTFTREGDSHTYTITRETAFPTFGSEVLVGGLVELAGLDNTFGIVDASIDDNGLHVTFEDSFDAQGNESFAGILYFSNRAVGVNGFVAGAGNYVSGKCGIALGRFNTVRNESGFVAGMSCEVTGAFSTNLGYQNVVAGDVSTAIGYKNVVKGFYSFVSGYSCLSEKNNSILLGRNIKSYGGGVFGTGQNTEIYNSIGSAFGDGTKSKGRCQMTIGSYNAEDEDGLDTFTTEADAFIVGNGNKDNRSNAFRVKYDGSVYGLSAYNSTGADYGEYLEWEDGNPGEEDRIGRFVTLTENGKIRIAGEGEDAIGVVSGISSIIGNANEDAWEGKYLRDVYGRLITEDVEVDDPDFDPEKEDAPKKVVEHRLKLNPTYDATQKYVPRSKRKEWCVVGLLGQVIVIDDGTCKVGQKCSVRDGGIATAGDKYRVVKRLNSNHVMLLANFL